jgi:hypothetical protein
MSTKVYLVGLLVVVLGLFGSVMLAQDATPTPQPEDADAVVGEPEGVGAVTGDSEEYYGREVTLEGKIEELVNVRSFVLGEGAILFNSQVLVINNTGREFDLRVMADQWVVLTGVVHPSIDEGGLMGLRTLNGDLHMDTSPMTEATPVTEGEAAVTPVPQGEDMAYIPGLYRMEQYDLSNMWIPERLHRHTIVELTSIESITFVDR